MTGLRDIAKQAGVSTSTVSRALHGSPRISEATRQRVEQVAAALNYRPNDLAGRVMSEHRRKRGVEQLGAIALLLETPLTHGYPAGHPFRRFCQGVETAASARGFSVDPINLDEFRTGRLDQILRGRGHRGILVAPSVKPVKSILRFDHNHFSVIMTGWGWQHPPFHRVATDHAAAMRLGIHHLRHGRGKRIATLVNAHADRRCDHAMQANFLAHHPAGSTAAARLFFEDSDKGLDRLHSAAERQAFDALIFSNEALRHRLTGFDFSGTRQLSLDGPLPAEMQTVGYFDQRYDIIGTWALELLITEMLASRRSLPEHQKTLLVPPQWIELRATR